LERRNRPRPRRRREEGVAMTDDFLAKVLIADRQRERERQRLIREAERARADEVKARRPGARIFSFVRHRVPRPRRPTRKAA